MLNFDSSLPPSPLSWCFSPFNVCCKKGATTIMKVLLLCALSYMRTISTKALITNFSCDKSVGDFIANKLNRYFHGFFGWRRRDTYKGITLALLQSENLLLLLPSQVNMGCCKRLVMVVVPNTQTKTCAVIMPLSFSLFWGGRTQVSLISDYGDYVSMLEFRL